ncbi:CopM family metallochaperone [Roseovarius sp. D0-M9]|uniref:CopM family metallochaperone n=1 Tax=Roseovarius sp. D0-M9 TaxID=3127117 RepID=UPI00300F8E37
MKTTGITASLIVLAGLTAGGFAVAETTEKSTEMDHSSHTMTASDGTPASTQAFIAANDAMHADMAIEMTGDADVDFIRGMIPHHQGAVAMAEIALEHGEDPEVIKLAQEIIDAQRAEIAWMEEWLTARGH